MNCINNRLNVAHAYKGETIVCDFTLRDDDGAIINNISDAVVLITDLSHRAQPLEKSLESGITFNNGNLRFMLTPTESATLPKKCGIEVKVVTNGMTRIAVQKDFLVMLDNQVKDV